MRVNDDSSIDVCLIISSTKVTFAWFHHDYVLKLVLEPIINMPLVVNFLLDDEYLVLFKFWVFVSWIMNCLYMDMSSVHHWWPGVWWIYWQLFSLINSQSESHLVTGLLLHNIVQGCRKCQYLGTYSGAKVRNFSLHLKYGLFLIIHKSNYLNQKLIPWNVWGVYMKFYVPLILSGSGPSSSYLVSADALSSTSSCLLKIGFLFLLLLVSVNWIDLNVFILNLMN